MSAQTVWEDLCCFSTFGEEFTSSEEKKEKTRKKGGKEKKEKRKRDVSYDMLP